jgi:hypothetical protein
MTFFRVARGGAAPSPVLRPGVEDVSAFLVAHGESLLKRAADGSTANASFGDTADEALLEAIRSGDDAMFLASAGVLGARLVEEMGKVGNAASGLLLCTTVADGDGDGAYAVVLKLEVISEQGAVLKTLDDGEETLAAVKDVLDQPGKLQKGLVYPDDRPGSEAVVGDLSATQEARYFLKAARITLEARPASSAAALVQAVAREAGPAVAQRVAAALPDVAQDATPQVLAAVREAVPDLGEHAAAAVAAALAGGDRPVVRVDTQAPVKGRVKAGPLTVTGPADEIGAVTWEADPEGGWSVSFHSDEEPSRSWS